MAPSTRKKYARRLIACLLLVILAGLVGPAAVGRFAPSLVVSQVFPELADRIDVGSIRLSWTEPVAIEGLTVRDDQGRTLADVPRVKTQLTLADWIRQPSRLGTIEIVEPHVTMRRDGDAWNFDQLVAALAARPKGKPVEAVAIKVSDGRVTVINKATTTEVKLTGWQSQFVWEQGTLQGDISVEHVTTSTAGVERPWDVPLELTADMRWIDDAPSVRALSGSTPFGSVQMSGDPKRGKLRATLDIATLHKLLGAVFAPDVERAAGQFSLEAAWEPDGNATVLSAGAQLVPFALSRRGGAKLEAMRWRLTGSGRIEPVTSSQGWTVTQASMVLDCDGEQFTAKTTAPVPWHGLGSNWPLVAGLNGKIEHWTARWNALAGPSARMPEAWGKWSGDVVIDVQGVLDGEHLEIEAGTARGRELVWARGTETWSEPVWNVTLDDLQWHFAPAALRLAKGIVQTSSVSGQFQSLEWDRSAGGVGLQGGTSMRVDLETTTRKLIAVGLIQPTDGVPQGELIVRGVGRSDGTGESFNMTFDVATLRWALRNSDASETNRRTVHPIGRVRGELLGMREGNGTWRAEKLRVAVGDALSTEVSGYWKLSDADRPFAVTGTYSYDLAKLRSWWMTLPNDIEVDGAFSQPLSLKGAWPASRSLIEAAAEWEGFADLAWNRVDSFGFHAEPGKTRVELQQGIVAARRTTVRWENGGAEIEPRLIFASGEPVLELVAPTRVDRLSLTPAMCAAWLQYVLPLAAETARAEGELSLDVARCRIPIGQWPKAEIEGTLVIHRGKIGPSNEVKGAFSVLQLARLLDGRDAERAGADWIELPAQEVACQLRDGKVRHRGLRMRLGPMALASDGQVGLDETIDVALRLRFPKDVVENQPLLAGFRDREIEVPLQGTLKKPKLKGDALQSFSKRLFEGSANEFLRRGLDNLFKP